MIDVVSYVLNPDGVRHAAIFCLWISAVIVGVMAFVATHDAGVHCPLAFLRAMHRVFMVMFAICLAYLAAWLAEHPDRTPAGPALLVDMSMMLVFIVSVIRHSLAAPVPITNSWRGAFQIVKRKTLDLFLDHHDDNGHPQRG